MWARGRLVRSILLCAGLIAVVFALGWLTNRGGSAGAEPPGVTPGRTGDPDTGRQIYQQDCAICHGVQGEGSFQGPPIADKGTASVDFMVRTGRMPLAFRGGLPNDVPAGEPSYTDEQIRALVAYTGQFIQGPPVPEQPDISGADVAAGGELYRLNCSACHQMAGSGGALAYGTVGPPLSDSSPVEVIEAMRTGPSSMPVFPSTVLDDREATQIAAYVDYLHHPEDKGGLNLWHLGPVPEGLVAWIFGIGGVLLLCRWLGERDRVSTD